MTHEQLNIEYLLKCKGWTKNKQGRLVDPHGQVRPKGMHTDFSISVTELGAMMNAVRGFWHKNYNLNQFLMCICVALKVKVK